MNEGYYLWLELVMVLADNVNVDRKPRSILTITTLIAFLEDIFEPENYIHGLILEDWHHMGMIITGGKVLYGHRKICLFLATSDKDSVSTM